jgi:hypothetical protein
MTEPEPELEIEAEEAGQQYRTYHGIAICGPGRCGKDTVAAWFRDHRRMAYAKATSEVIVPHAARKIGLSDSEMFARRHEFRPLMFDTGVELRRDDPAYLAREVLKTGDLVVGVRDRVEMEAVRREKLVDLAIWIDRDVPPDPTMGYGPELCDIIVPNRWGLPELYGRLETLANLLNL